MSPKADAKIKAVFAAWLIVISNSFSFRAQSLERLDRLFCKYLYKGRNPFTSKHVKQTPHEPNLMWASNQYLIVFQVRDRTSDYAHGRGGLRVRKIKSMYAIRCLNV